MNTETNQPHLAWEDPPSSLFPRWAGLVINLWLAYVQVRKVSKPFEFRVIWALSNGQASLCQAKKAYNRPREFGRQASLWPYCHSDKWKDFLDWKIYTAMMIEFRYKWGLMRFSHRKLFSKNFTCCGVSFILASSRNIYKEVHLPAKVGMFFSTFSNNIISSLQTRAILQSTN